MVEFVIYSSKSSIGLGFKVLDIIRFSLVWERLTMSFEVGNFN